MALKQIASPRTPFVNARGEPVAGGYITVKEPGGANDVPAYTSSARTASHTPPNIGLSGSGRVNVWVNQDCDVRVYDRNDNLISEDLSVNPSSGSSEDSGGLLVNGSFEIDDDADTIPDAWTLNSEAGSTNAIDSSTSSDGGQCFRFTSSGSGGGDLTTTNFFEVNETQDLRVQFDILSNPAGLRNRVRVQWYDITQAFISNTDVYDSTANPTTFTEENTVATPPTGARYAKLQIFGAVSTVATPGSVYFDRVSAYYPVSLTGVFDNITIQLNQIITTSGALEITPLSPNPINLGNTNAVDLVDVNNALNIGSNDPDNNAHLAFGPAQMQAKTDTTTAAALSINSLGGNLNLGPQSGSGKVSDYFNGARISESDTYGLNLFGTLSGSPSTSSAHTLLQFFNTDQSSPHGRVGFIGTNLLQLKNFRNSGQIELRGTSAAGIEIQMADFGSGYFNLYDTGIIKIRSGTFGMQLAGSSTNLPSAGTTQNTYLEMYNQSMGAGTAVVGHQNTTQLRVQNNVYNGNIEFRATTSGGSVQTLATLIPGGQFQLYHANALKLHSNASGNGIEIRGGSANDPTAGGAQSTLIYFNSSGGLQAGLAGFEGASTVLELINRIHGGTVDLAAENSGGVEKLLFHGDPAAGVTLGFAGVVAAQTLTDGLRVYDTTSDAPFVELRRNSDDAVAGWFAGDFTLGGSVGLHCDIDSGIVVLSANNASSSFIQMLTADPDSYIEMKYNGAAVARTLAAASGGFEVNNTSTGAGFERVLTVSDLPSTLDVYSNSTTSVTNSTTYVDTGLTITVPAAGVYEIDLFCDWYYVSTTVDGTAKFRLYRADIPAAVTNLFQWPNDDSFSAIQIENNSAITHSYTSVPSATYMPLRCTGIVTTTTTNEQVVLQIAQNTASASQTVRFVEGYMRLRRVDV